LGLLRYCPICDGYEHREKNLAIFVKDHEGVERALFMTRFTKKIKVIAIEGYKFTAQTKHNFKRLGLTWAHGIIEKIIPKGRSGTGLWIKLKKQRRFFVSAAYVELGCVVNDFAFKHLKKLRISKAGFLITTSEQRLSIPGLFAVGDCVNSLGQLSVAAGQAAIAATAIHNELGS
jgi:thioredoxin reductase (NADPH)